jgi:hypothetical protein
MKLERLGLLKKPVTSSGIEPTTFLLKIEMNRTALKIVHENKVVLYKSFRTINSTFDQD